MIENKKYIYIKEFLEETGIVMENLVIVLKENQTSVRESGGGSLVSLPQVQRQWRQQKTERQTETP